MMNKSVFLGVAAILVAGAGLATVVLGWGDGDTTGKPIVIALANEASETIPPAPVQAQSAFETMAVEETEASCAVPFAPNDLHQDLLMRSGYASIMRIIAAKRWEETGSCECFYAEISWEDVVEAAPHFAESEAPGSDLNPTKLRRMADELESRRAMVCDG